MCVTKFKQTEGKMNLRGIDVQTVSVQPLESKKENVKQAKMKEAPNIFYDKRIDKELLLITLTYLDLKILVRLKII